MADNLDPKVIDKRTWERHVLSGRLDDKAFERYLKSLPDVADKAASVETVVQPTAESSSPDQEPNAV
jgi:hypothetical protein